MATRSGGWDIKWLGVYKFKEKDVPWGLGHPSVFSGLQGQKGFQDTSDAYACA